MDVNLAELTMQGGLCFCPFILSGSLGGYYV